MLECEILSCLACNESDLVQTRAYNTAEKRTFQLMNEGRPVCVGP